MKKPRMARIFFQTTKGKTKERKRGYMTIPVWLGLAESTDGFMVFHDVGDFFTHFKRIQNSENSAIKTTGIRKRLAEHTKGQKRVRRKTKKR